MGKKHLYTTEGDELAGGQALIEGVMMRHRDRVALAVRRSDGSIELKEETYVSLTRRYSVLGWYVIRGFVTFLEMVMLGVKGILFSAEMALREEEQEMSSWQLHLSIAFSFLIVFLFFILIPAYGFTLLREHIGNTFLLNIAEGSIRLVVFLLFLSLTLFMGDMRRVYMYHGAEHKTVFAWEDGKELTVENIRPYPTRHPRCGTSFVLVVMVVSIFVFSLLGRPAFFERVFYKLLLLPVIAGISYEIVRFTGKFRKSKMVKLITWPGLLLQRITTREPTDDQIEVAIAAMKKVI
ncbi:MAG: DUF1385 domain-containing protein [Syntrophales bacterium]|nr:DUF1385 domain-containing protein [Syntrophales bacterium]